MSVIQKTIRGKKIIAFCLLLVGIFTVIFAQSAYAAPSSNPVTLEVEQIFTKPASSSAADTFTYNLTAKEAGNPLPSGSADDVYTFTIDGTGSVDVGEITFSKTGVYNYELEQDAASPVKGYTYDTQVYAVAVYIDYALNAEIIIKKQDGEKTDSIVFENSYAYLASDPSLMVDPPVNKTVSGNPGKDSTFTFKLEAKDKSNPMPTGSSNGVKTLTIVGSGTKDFGTWSYADEGTYYYTISEVNAGENGYTYDTAVYTITDSVKDEDGQLMLTRTVTNASNKQVSACDFINKYSSTTTGGGGKNGPKTGDDSMTELYTTMLCISGAALIGCVIYLLLSKKRKKEGSVSI